MRKSRSSEEQIIKILKEQDAGGKLADICRRHGISEQTFHRWKAKFRGMDVNEARRLKQLEDENRRLKHLVAVSDARQPGAEADHRKKVVTPTARRQVVGELQQAYGMSERRSLSMRMRQWASEFSVDPPC